MDPNRRRVLLAGLATSILPTGPAPAAEQGRVRLKRGVNLWPWFSLTREYPAPRTDYADPPFELDRPVPSSADLARLRRIGLDFVRIPVDPGPYCAAGSGPRAALLNTLFDAVAQALDADLSVVLNIQANAATHFWTPGRLYGTPDPPAFAAYCALVVEIARRLGRLRSNRVVLEPVNEPPQGCASPDWPDKQVILLRGARQAAPDLTLVATGACGSMVSGLVALDPTPLKAYEPVLYTFHFYEPYLFSHQGAPWMTEPVYRALNTVPWPGSAGTLDRTLSAVRTRMAADTGRSAAQKQSAYAETERVLKVYFDAQPDRPFIDGYLAKVQAWAARNGIEAGQVLLGEFGALGSDARYVAAGRADRIRYIRDVRKSAEAFGFPWAMWNLFDGMGMMNDVTHDLDRELVGPLGLTVPPP